MWTCTICNQEFIKTKQSHSCHEKALADFLKGKSAHTVGLFNYFTAQFQKIGKVTVHPTKSMIAFAGTTRMAYLTRLGKDFIDITFLFTQPYQDNLCFHKIAQVPGTQQFNHHFRMYRKEDVNEEVLAFMELAYHKS